MGSFVRTLLIWLLVLALPSQGVLAATMAFCGPDHHGGASGRAEVSVDSEHAHHDHSGVHDSVDAFDAAILDEAPDVEHADPTTQKKCSACASCCSLGAILSMVPAVPPTDPAPTEFITVAPTVDAVAAGGPDRPPRNTLA